MNLYRVERIAKDLINYLLPQDQYAIKFNFNSRLRTMLGRTLYYKDISKRIDKTYCILELSAKFVELNTENHVVYCILHEIAHCMYPFSKHNLEWKRAFEDLLVFFGYTSAVYTLHPDVIENDKYVGSKEREI